MKRKNKNIGIDDDVTDGEETDGPDGADSGVREDADLTAEESVRVAEALRPDLWPLVKDWVAAKKQEGVRPDAVLAVLGLRITNLAGQDEDMVWGVVATVLNEHRGEAGQIRPPSLPSCSTLPCVEIAPAAAMAPDLVSEGWAFASLPPQDAWATFLLLLCMHPSRYRTLTASPPST